MDLLAFERKLDQTIARKRMEIQEAIKKPIMVSTGDGSWSDCQIIKQCFETVFRLYQARHHKGNATGGNNNGFSNGAHLKCRRSLI